MKDWKKCTAFLLALVICLGLAACGVGSSEGEREDYYTPGVIEDTDYDFTDDNPAEQLGYDSIEDMRTQEHEIISSDDNDNTVAEGYWYPDGDRSSSLWSREIPFTGMNLTRSRGIFKRENRMALYSS
jgi:hypothetical protein